MRLNVRRRIAAIAVAGLSALALLAVTAGPALAAVTTVNGRLLYVGRGGVFRVPPAGAGSVASTLVAIGVSALAIAAVALIFIGLDRRSATRLAAVPTDAGAPQRSSASHDQERKAA